MREWYAPILERSTTRPRCAWRTGAAGRISESFETRETVLTELSLDPPSATSDLAGPPLLDEDYLVLSTVHSAKGQEWEAVYVINVSDGNFPNEFATGKPEQIEEERRLLYVAMTRAKTSLDLISPLKYYVTQQSRMGDRHVYGAKSRFLTRQSASCFDEVSGRTSGKDVPRPKATAVMWRRSCGELGRPRFSFTWGQSPIPLPPLGSATASRAHAETPSSGVDSNFGAALERLAESRPLAVTHNTAVPFDLVGRSRAETENARRPRRDGEFARYLRSSFRLGRKRSTAGSPRSSRSRTISGRGFGPGRRSPF